MKPQHFTQLACRLTMVAMLALTACSQSSNGAGNTGGGVNNPAVVATPSSEIITRTDSSPLDLQATVLLDIYKQEAYQDTYPVEVPYQEEETYYVDIPYTEREAYTDYEEYYENEYQCHTTNEQECSYERECRQVPDRQCHQERQCRQERLCRPGRPGQERCQEVEECGTNAQGERICKVRKVCDREPDQPEDCDYVERCENVERCDNSGYREECSQERRCRNVPREQCGYEQVRKTRPVTKYRDVTKYRQEPRTRTVTKYRTEYKCCVTKYREVIDRQDSYAVTVQFPATAELQPNETETIQITLVGGSHGEAVSAEIKELNTVYGYKIASQSTQGNTVVIKLELGATYSPIEIGANTVTEHKLKIFENLTAAVSFTDVGAKEKTTSIYDVEVTDMTTGKVIATAQARNVGGTLPTSLKVPLTVKLTFDRDYSYKLTVTRSGPKVGPAISFVKTGVRKH